MHTQTRNNSNRTSLIAEVERYLAAIEAFRAEGREPHWRPELLREEVARRRRRKGDLHAPPIP